MVTNDNTVIFLLIIQKRLKDFDVIRSVKLMTTVDVAEHFKFLVIFY